MRWTDPWGVTPRTVVIDIVMTAQKYFLQSPNALAATGVSAGSGTANKAFYFPFELERQSRFTTAWIYNANTIAGNWDIGIYDEEGNRRWSSGSTAMAAGTNAPQTFTISGGITLARGGWLLGVAHSTGTGAPWVFNGGNAIDHAAAGSFSQTSAFPLPATATFAQNVTAWQPYIGIVGRSL
jgi:hypothetical protein